jgi:hypothetical protein
MGEKLSRSRRLAVPQFGAKEFDSTIDNCSDKESIQCIIRYDFESSNRPVRLPFEGACRRRGIEGQAVGARSGTSSSNYCTNQKPANADPPTGRESVDGKKQCWPQCNRSERGLRRNNVQRFLVHSETSFDKAWTVSPSPTFIPIQREWYRSAAIPVCHALLEVKIRKRSLGRWTVTVHSQRISIICAATHEAPAQLVRSTPRGGYAEAVC